MTSSTRISAGRPDARIARIAATQASTFSRGQALSVGFSETTMKRRVRTGVWHRVHPGVYRFAGAPPTWHAEVWAALLAVGPLATVTHETALRLHGSELVAPRPITLTVPHGGHARVHGAFVHQIDDLRPHHVVSVGGLPVSGAPRAIVEASAALGPRQLGRVLDELVLARRTSLAQVAGRLAEVARRGKPGVARLAACWTRDRTGRCPRVASSNASCAPRWLGPGCRHPSVRPRCPDPARSRGSWTPPTPTAASSSRPMDGGGTLGCRIWPAITPATPRQLAPGG